MSNDGRPDSIFEENYMNAREEKLKLEAKIRLLEYTIDNMKKERQNTLVIKASKENEFSSFICSNCGNSAAMVIHNDFMCGWCCGDMYYKVKMDDKVWNCCSKPLNG